MAEKGIIYKSEWNDRNFSEQFTEVKDHQARVTGPDTMLLSPFDSIYLRLLLFSLLY